MRQVTVCMTSADGAEEGGFLMFETCTKVGTGVVSSTSSDDTQVRPQHTLRIRWWFAAVNAGWRNR
jgi:hypothetical protein